MLATLLHWSWSALIWIAAFIGGLILLGIASLFINLLLNLLARVSLQRIKVAGSVLRQLSGVPADAALASDGSYVSLLRKNADGQYKVPVSYKLLAWKGPVRAVAAYARSLRRHRLFWIIAASAELIVVAGTCAWLSWKWATTSSDLAAPALVAYSLAGGLVLHSFTPFYIWLWPGIGGNDFVNAIYEETTGAISEAVNDTAPNGPPGIATSNGLIIARLRQHQDELQAFRTSVSRPSRSPPHIWRKPIV